MESEKYQFIKKYEGEIRPIAENQEVLNDIDAHAPVSNEQITALLEQYETKVFVYESPQVSEGAGRLLLEASQPANFKVVHPLVEALKNDERCAGFTLLTDGVSGKQFVEEGDPSLELTQSSERPVIADIPNLHYRSALVLDDGVNSPASILLHGAKSVFGAEKLCYLSLGLFGHMERKIFGPSRSQNLDEIDIIFSADEFSKKMLCDVLGVPQEKVVVTGTPLLENLRVEEADELRKRGREVLGISDTTTVLSYMGFPSADFRTVGGAEHLNTRTFEQTLEGALSAATSEPEREFVIIARTHPRARNVEPSLMPTRDLPSNLKVLDGDSLQYEEAVYASDIICCNVLSTESLLARYRGREVAVFSFSGEGQTGELLRKDYGKKGEDILRESDRVILVDSSEKLSDTLRGFTQREALPVVGGSLRRMQDILLTPNSTTHAY